MRKIRARSGGESAKNCKVVQGALMSRDKDATAHELIQLL
jgi:hypothetical protein